MHLDYVAVFCLDMLWLNTASCHEGSCDCDRVFQEHSGHFPDVCNVRKLLKSLEPYRETYARQQITVAFSLFDRPWFTATSEPVHGANGLIETESQLPSQYAPSSQRLTKLVRCAIVCITLRPWGAAGWYRAIGLGGYSMRASETAFQVSFLSGGARATALTLCSHEHVYRLYWCDSLRCIGCHCRY
eukprot:scaffold2927_cov408-Prasinococcus_capsulatus_cf.AAC.19